ncbi:glycosyltransferase family 1 protein [bacterium]|nr:glycosyltransferase family 1 protein [bacterium]
MTAPTAVFFSMEGHGHLRRLLPVVAGLAAAGLRVCVFAERRYREEVEQAGGEIMDLYSRGSLAEADAESIPTPCRYVTFAGLHAEAILSEVAALEPSLIVHDSFAVIGQIVARRLGLPRVNVCAGHNVTPATIQEILSDYARLVFSDACKRAVETLRTRDLLPDATPLAFATPPSPDLNLYCEPPQFLRPDERPAFAPLEFIGSLSPQNLARGPSSTQPFGADPAIRRRLFVCLGTVVWRRYEALGRELLETVSRAVAEQPDTAAIISLGGATPGPWADALRHARVRVEDYVDQWDVLAHADLFLTHQGLNSTHEAICQEVPMISYPIFWDQPALATRCRELGLAVPLVEARRGPVTVDDVRSALATVAAARERLRDRLREARAWELDVVAQRPRVIDRVLALADR